MIIEEVQKNNPAKSNELIRIFLGSMLFRGEDVFELLARLEDASNEEEIEKITTELDKL